jgi:type II secretory pathway component GspD/PulD (secretin)
MMDRKLNSNKHERTGTREMPKDALKTFVVTVLFLGRMFFPSAFAQEGLKLQEDPRAQEENVTQESGGISDAATITDAGPGKISLDLKGVDIVELLKILALKMDINIVPTKEVTGRVNVFLNNVTIEDALDIILISNSLAAVKEKNIITVMTLEKYTQLYGKKYKEPRKIRTLALKHASPKDISAALAQLKTDVGKIIVDEATGTVILVDIPEALDLMERTVKTLDTSKATQVFTLKYAKAEDIKSQLSTVLTPGSSTVELDSRTNKIAISDLPDKMKKINQLITAFDDDTKQVLIEAQIVQISLNDHTRFGVDWEKLFNTSKINGLDYKGKFPVTGLSSTLGEMSVGTLAANNFNIVVQALNSIAKTNILSRPRIAVVNNQEASILIGAKEVYFSQTQSQSSVTTTTAESVNYVDVGVKLNVTPTISDDGFIVMKIRPEVSSVRETATSPLGSKVPVVETSQAETVVKVKDKAMIMIAGLMKEDARYNRDQLPWVGNLPFLSWLFGNKDTQRTKTELAIFLTPRIITGDIERVDAEKEEVKSRGVLTKKIKGRQEGLISALDE